MRKITVQHNGETYTGQIGTIQRTFLGYEHHGIFTANLSVEGEGWGISLGDYTLDSYDPEIKDRVGTAFGLDHIIHIMKTLGVDRWEDVRGQQVMVLYKGDVESVWGSQGVGIAHVSDENKILIFKEHVEDWKRREGLL